MFYRLSEAPRFHPQTEKDSVTGSGIPDLGSLAATKTKRPCAGIAIQAAAAARSFINDKPHRTEQLARQSFLLR